MSTPEKNEALNNENNNNIEEEENVEVAPPPQNPNIDVEAPNLEPSEENSKYAMMFSHRAVRARFVRKVFTLVTIMFFIVAVFCSVPLIDDDFAKWCIKNWWWEYVAMAFFIAFYIILYCFSSIRRKFPLNMFMLGIFTFSAAVMTMFIVAHYTAQSVLITLCITTLCSGAIIAFAIYTDRDLTSCLGVAFILGICLMAFGLMAIVFVIVLKWKFLFLIYSGLGALLMMFYLAIDIQLLMGGRKFELAPNEYVFGAMEIFLDILNLFMMLLNLFGVGR